MINWKTTEWFNNNMSKGLSFKKMAKLAGVSDVMVGLVARELGIKAHQNGKLQRKYDIGYDELYNLYIVQKLKSVDIATKLNVALGTVILRLREYGLLRKREDTRKLRLELDGRVPYEQWANYNWLHLNYVALNKTISGISKEVGWAYSVVHKAICQHGIPTRSDSDASKLRSSTISQTVKEWWSKPKNKKHMAYVFNTRSKVSKLALTFYGILDDLNIKYFREYEDGTSDKECVINGFNCDCVIPRDGKPWLVVELNGAYYHSLEPKRKRDKEKREYFLSVTDKYEFKTIWEHEFKCEKRVYELAKYWLEIYDDNVDFSFKDIVVKDDPDNYKEFLAKYHYLGNRERGGIDYGAYHNGKLVAYCSFSPLVRQNINIDGYTKTEVRELSRFCIHPRYQKKNFSSWLISRFIKRLPTNFKVIVSYSDATHNHYGTIYKASNFIRDRILSPDYWYVDNDGRQITKKNVYNLAKSCKMIEADYYMSVGLSKIYGFEKYRYIYKR